MAVWAWRGYLAAVALTVVGALAFPVAFQKSVCLTDSACFEDLGHSVSGDNLSDVFSQIPRRVDRTMSYAVAPKQRFQRTVLEGQGNCSNVSFGLAYWLNEQNSDYQIVHLLPRTECVWGRGHTILRAKVQGPADSRPGLLDPLSGVAVWQNDRRLDVDELLSAPRSTIRLEPLGKMSRGDAELSVGYYADDFRQASEIGWSSAAEVRRYYKFLDTIYLPLGSDRVEKYLYDGAALLMGYYPPIHVVSARKTLSGIEWLRWICVGGLWLVRSAIIVMPVAWLVRWKLRSDAGRRSATD